MPAWRQNSTINGWPRNGTAPTKDCYPLSVTVYGPQGIPQGMENPGSTLPSDGFSAQPSFVDVNVSFGMHDALHGELMAVSQADLYNSDPCPWPAAGTWEQPGGPIAASAITRLQPTTSAHPGLASATGAGPAMLFVAPPVFTVQSQPIFAVGL
jgi:hypothetical protein